VSTVGQPYVPEQYAFADPAAVLRPAEARAEPLAVAPAAQPPVQPGLMPSTTPMSRASLAAPPPGLEAPAVVQQHVTVEPAGAATYKRPNNDQATPDDLNVTDLLVAMVDAGASDLHLTSGAPPMMRQRGELRPLGDHKVLTPHMLQRSLYALLSQRQRERFEAELELDFAYSVPGKARFRVNVYRQRESLGAAFRLIPYEIKPLEALGVPPAVGAFAQLARGMVLVTGPTGSGKSTTLAGILDLANRTRHEHIMTVEDPIVS
jgi:twitching motility protein PilT